MVSRERRAELQATRRKIMKRKVWKMCSYETQMQNLNPNGGALRFIYCEQPARLIFRDELGNPYHRAYCEKHLERVFDEVLHAN